MKKFIIGKSDAGKRLDRFMEEEAGWPRSLLMKAIRTKKLKVNGKKQEAAYRTEEGDEIVSYVLERTGESDFSIVYEDDNILGTMEQKSGTLTHYLFKDAKKNKVFLSTVPVKGTKTAVMSYRVKAEKNGLSLVECDLLTGRTHQIRSQLASISHPILGDDKYGKKEINRRYREKGQLLCACRLSFEVKEKSILSYLDGRSFTVPQVSFIKKYFSR